MSKQMSGLRDLSVDELRDKERDLDDQLFRLRIQKSMGQLEAPLKVREVRRQLARVKTRARASLIRGLNSNQGLAFQLATAQTVLGDWREAFRQLRRVEAVTAADVQRVAKELFKKRNRTVGKIVKPEEAAE